MGAVDWADLKKKVQDHHLETLQEISKVRDVDELVNRFVAWVTVLLDEKSPVKRTVFRQKYTRWMMKEVLALVKEKSKMLAKYHRTHLDVHRQRWLKMKTKVSNSCRKAEHEYWKEQLKDGVDSQTLWKQSYKYVGQKSPGAPTQVIVDGKMITDPAKVADACQDAQLGKVDRITSNIPASHIDPIDYTHEYYCFWS